MAKRAHITSRPEVEVGDRALALCGKDFKVKVLWDDIPKDKFICRECVDMACLAMTQADAVIYKARAVTELLLMRAEALAATLVPDDLALDVIAEFTENFENERTEKRRRKEIEERAKRTCTCTWLSDSAQQVDENCPIHGHSSGGTGYDDAGLGESEAGDDGRPPIAPGEER